MATRNEIFDINAKGEVKLHLHPGQAKAWDSDRRFVFVIAGTQGGKTTFGPWWIEREIHECGKGDYLVVTSTYDLFKLKLLPSMLKVFEQNLGWHYLIKDRTLYSPDEETRIILRSADAEGGLESATAKAAWLDECGQDKFKLTAWEAVQRRLSLSQGRVLATTTPYNMGWLKTQVFDRWRKGDDDYQVISFKSIDNPAFPMEEYERARDTLPTWKFRMFYQGEFARPAGMIYSDFNDQIHVIDPVPLKKEWSRYVGIDFGAVNTALVWMAHDTDKDCYYLYRESLEGNMTTKEHAAKAKSHARTEKVVVWTGGAKSEKQQRMDWRAEGIAVREPRISDVEAGIDRVIELLKTHRLFIFNTCTGIIDEFGTYSRELDADGKPTAKIKDKNDYHRLDAIRYDVAGIGMPSGASLIGWAG